MFDVDQHRRHAMLREQCCTRLIRLLPMLLQPRLQQIILDDAVYLIPYYQGNIEAVRTDTFTGWFEGEATFGLGDPTSLKYVHPVE